MARIASQAGISRHGYTDLRVYSADKMLHTACAWDYSNTLLIVLYILLFGCCLLLLRENFTSCQAGQSGGLLWYLSCTSVLCVCRFLSFALVLLVGTDAATGCQQRYRTFQWDMEGSGDPSSRLSLELLVLSTSSSALFFSSYSYFAHSLSKVLDILTLDEDAPSSALKYALLLVALNSCVWCSIFLLWAARIFRVNGADVVDEIAQLSLAVAALTTCITFGVHFQRVYRFLQRNDASDGRAAQINELLKLRRVLGVCSVCTVCFASRAMVLLCRFPLGAVEADAYFFLSEVLPTAFMLNAFRSSSVNASHIELGGQSIGQGFEGLKESFGADNYFQNKYSPIKANAFSTFSMGGDGHYKDAAKDAHFTYTQQGPTENCSLLPFEDNT